MSASRFVQFAKTLPIDFYLLILIPFIGIIIMMGIDASSFSLKTLLFLFFFGGPFLLVAGGMLYIYFFARIAFMLLSLILFKKHSSKEVFAHVKNFTKSQIYLSVVFATSLLFVNFMANYLSLSTPASKVVWASHLLTDWDFLLTGRDMYFKLSSVVNSLHIPDLGFMLITSYKMLSVAIPVMLLILMIKNKEIARKFIIHFFLVQFLAFPIWFAIPALDPGTMYIRNILQIELPGRIAAELADYKPEKMLAEFQASYFKNYVKNKEYLALTAFPSMHTAWGLGVVLYAFELSWILGIVAIEWFVMEIIGAVYLGQHYVVDIGLGIVIALVVYFLVKAFLKLEKKYYTKESSFGIIDYIQADVKLLVQAIKKYPLPFLW